MNYVKRKIILLVEDDVIQAVTESKKLSENGYEVEFVHSGEEAIELIKNEPTGYDLIIMDINLGKGLNGLETSRKILEIKDIPIVFLTSYKDQDLVRQIKSVARYGYVLKGSEDFILMLTIETAVDLFQSKQKIENLEADFIQMAENINEIFWLRDINNKSIIYVSPTYEKVWGRTCQSVYANPDSFMDIIHPDDRDAVKTIYENLRLKPLAFEYEYRIVRDDGETRWIRTSVNPVFDKNGSLFRNAGISEDITSLKMAEDEIVKTKKKLKETFNQAREFEVAAKAATVAKEQFLDNMSHEIRTPLNGIIGITSLLLESELTDDQKEYLKIMQSSGDTLLTMINQILDLSEIKSQEFKFDVDSFNLRELMHYTAEMFAFQAFKKNLTFNFTIDHNIPDLMKGNSERLRQILTNLLYNAIKFADEGGIDLSVIMIEENDTDVKLKFEINDTGIGIPEKYIKEIFNPFTQVDGRMNRRYGGTGLGLAINKKIVEFMGGEIGVKRNERNGSLFWFTVVLQKQNTAQTAFKEIEKTGNIYTERKSAAILLVEDNKTNQLVVSSMLKKLGYKTDIAYNGYECINALRKKEYSLVLMDCQMPDKDGFETTKEIRNGNSGVINPDILIIALTANAMNGDRERCIKTGMNDYISKPVKVRELDQHLKKWLISGPGEYDNRRLF